MNLDFDYRKLQKYFSAQAFNDLNDLLESLPVRAGYGLLVAAGIAWIMAGATIFYAIVQAQQVAELRAELLKADALKPQVPKIVRSPVAEGDVRDFARKIDKVYDNVKVTSLNDVIALQASSGMYYGAFREAVGHLFNGGNAARGESWRISVKSLCVGRECKPNFLNGQFQVYKLAVDKG